MNLQQHREAFRVNFAGAELVPALDEAGFLVDLRAQRRPTRANVAAQRGLHSHFTFTFHIQRKQTDKKTEDQNPGREVIHGEDMQERRCCRRS